MKTQSVAIFAACCAALAAAAAPLRFHPATVEEGRALITADDAHVKRMTKSDLDMRFPGKNATVGDYKKFAAEQVRPFTAGIARAFSNSFARIDARLAKLGFANPLTNEVTVVLTTMKEEFGAAGYTRGVAIFLNEDEFSSPSMPPAMLDYVMAHELFHVLSRQSPDFRKKMYAVIGFTLCDEPAFTPEVRARLVANPDVERFDCKAVFTIDGKPAEATIVSTLDESLPASASLMERMPPGLVPVAKPDRIIPIDDVPDFWKVVGRNSPYVIAAEECMAENFAFAVMFADDKHSVRRMPDPGKIKGVWKALRGCGGAQPAAKAPAEKEAAAGARKPLRVLMIGNSFSRPCVESLPPVARALGVELDIASLYIGGCSLERHCKNIETAATNAAFRPYRFDRNECGRKTVIDGRINIQEALAAAKWDVVTVQQVSRESWRPVSYVPWGDRLVAFVRERAPQAKIYVQETWSYTPLDKNLASWKITQDEMFSRLRDSYAAFAARNKLPVIPVGSAVQEWRRRLPVKYAKNSFGGDVVGKMKPKRDTFHLNERGEHLQALVWAQTLFKDADVRKCDWRPDCVTPEEAELMREIAAGAL